MGFSTDSCQENLLQHHHQRPNILDQSNKQDTFKTQTHPQPHTIQSTCLDASAELPVRAASAATSVSWLPQQSCCPPSLSMTHTNIHIHIATLRHNADRSLRHLQQVNACLATLRNMPSLSTVDQKCQHHHGSTSGRMVRSSINGSMA